MLIAGAFWWALHAGQYDDLDRPAEAVLLDNDKPSRGAVAGGVRPWPMPSVLRAQRGRLMQINARGARASYIHIIGAFARSVFTT